MCSRWGRFFSVCCLCAAVGLSFEAAQATGDSARDAELPQVHMTGAVAPNRAMVITADFPYRVAQDLDRIELSLLPEMRPNAAFRETQPGIYEGLELDPSAPDGTARLLLPEKVLAGTELKLRLRFRFSGRWVALSEKSWALEPQHALPEVARRLAGEGGALTAELEAPPGFLVFGEARNLVLVPETMASGRVSVGGEEVRLVAGPGYLSGMRPSGLVISEHRPILHISAVRRAGSDGESTVVSSGGSSNPLSISRAPEWGSSVPRRQQPSFLSLVLDGFAAQGEAFGPLGEWAPMLVTAEKAPVEPDWPWLVPVPKHGGKAAAGALHRTDLEEIDFALARRWWGGRVQPASEGDRWLFDGLAELGVALAVEKRGGWEAASKFWEQRREALWASSSKARGPLALASLSSPGSDFDAASLDQLRAFKGASVLQALRRFMAQAKPNAPDDRFFSGLKEFSSSFAGREASVADFQRVMEKHFRAEFYPAGQQGLDWFFQQWLAAEAMPSLSSDFKIRKLSGKKVRVEGTVTVAGVPAGFRLRVPVQARMARQYLLTLAHLVLEGPGDHPVDLVLDAEFKAKELQVDALGELLGPQDSPRR